MNRFLLALCALFTAILLVSTGAHAQETPQQRIADISVVPSIPALNASLGEDMEVDADGYRRRLTRLHDSVAPGTRSQGEYETFIACSAACVNRDGSSDVRSIQRCISLGVPSRLASHGYGSFGTLMSCNRGIDVLVDHARAIESSVDQIRTAAQRLPALEQRAARIEAELTSLRNSAGPMAEQNVALQLQISTLQTQLATANADLATARAQVAELQVQQTLASERTARVRPRRPGHPRVATARPPRQITTTTRGAPHVAHVQPRPRTPRATRVAAAANTGNSSDPAQADPARLPRTWRNGLTPMHVARGNSDWRCNLSVTVVRADMQVSPCVAGVNSQLSQLAIRLAALGPTEAYRGQVTEPDPDWNLWSWYHSHLTSAQFQALMAILPVNTLGRHLTLKARTPDRHGWSYIRIGRYLHHVLPTNLTTFRSRIPQHSGPTRIMVPDGELVWLPRGQAEPPVIDPTGGPSQQRQAGPPNGVGTQGEEGSTVAAASTQNQPPPDPPDDAAVLATAHETQRRAQQATLVEQQNEEALRRGTAGLDSTAVRLINAKNTPHFGKNEVKAMGQFALIVMGVLAGLYGLMKLGGHLFKVKPLYQDDENAPPASDQTDNPMSPLQKAAVERLSQPPEETSNTTGSSTMGPNPPTDHTRPTPDPNDVSGSRVREDALGNSAADPAQAGTG